MNDSIQRDDVPLVLVSSFIDTSYLNITSESREERVELRKTKRPLREHDKETDLLRVVYVSEFVMKRLGVYDGSWIDLKYLKGNMLFESLGFQPKRDESLERRYRSFSMF